MKLLPMIFLCALTLGCSAQTPDYQQRPIDLHDGIKTASMVRVGINPDSINELTNKIYSGYYPNIHSLLIYKNGYLVYESYFTGLPG